MSVPVMPAASLPIAAPPVQNGNQTTPATDGEFSRVLADQRPPATTTPDKPRAEPSESGDDTATHDDTPNVADAKNLRDKNHAERVDTKEDAAPEAALATLALDIARQTAAQLRGAALRASGAQADEDATTVLPARLASVRPEGWTTPTIDQTVTETVTTLVSLDAMPHQPDARRAFLLPSSIAIHNAASARTRQVVEQRTSATTTMPFDLDALPRHPLDTKLSRDVASIPTHAISATTATTASGHNDLALAASQIASAESAPHLPSRSDSAPAPLHVAVPVDSPQWGSALGRQLITLSQRSDGSNHSAELRLDPPELGPLRVTLTLHEGVAHAAFASPHASVRLAVEAAMSQLQSALAQTGISLGQTSVSDQHAAEQFAFGQTFEQASERHDEQASNTGDLAEGATPVRTMRGDTLIDTFV